MLESTCGIITITWRAEQSSAHGLHVCGPGDVLPGEPEPASDLAEDPLSVRKVDTPPPTIARGRGPLGEGLEGETQGRVTVEPPESRWRRRKDSRRDMDFCVCCDAA